MRAVRFSSIRHPTAYSLAWIKPARRRTIFAVGLLLCTATFLLAIRQHCQALDYCRWYDAHYKSTTSALKAPQPVRLTLYMESLCPDCKHYIVNTLYPAFEKLYPSGIWHLTIIPFGNAHEFRQGDHYTFKCQHGNAECHGNIIQTCALHQLGIAAAMKFIYCTEATRADDGHARKCAAEQGIHFGRLMSCVNGTEGNLLEHQMAKATNSLVPKHTSVPWLTLNGEHTDAIQEEGIEDTLKLICDNYKGKKPDACKETARKRKP